MEYKITEEAILEATEGGKYIDAEKLIEYLKKTMESYKSKMVDPTKYPIDHIDLMAFLAREYQAIILNVESLQQEQPEVYLEEELEKWRHDHFKGKRDGDYNGEYLERESQLDLARHFWNKGYNARNYNYDKA